MIGLYKKHKLPALPDCLKQWYPVGLCLTIYLGVTLILFTPFLFQHQTLFLSDISYNWEPLARFSRENWSLHGRMPLWNPFVLSGAPLIQICWPVAYIPSFPFLVLPFGIATGFFLSFHLLVAAVGGFWFRYYQETESDEHGRFQSALLLGLAFMLCGYMVGATVNMQLMATASWIPLALSLVRQIAVKPRLRQLCLLSLVLGLEITAGRPEIVLYSGLIYVSYLIFCPGSAKGSTEALKTRAVCLSTLVCALILAILLSAVDLLTIIELSASAPVVGSLSTLPPSHSPAGWFDLLGTILSQPFGRLSMEQYHLYPTHPGEMPYITSLFLGAPLVTLAIVGFYNRRWSQRWFWLTWCILSLIVSSGMTGGLVPGAPKIISELLVFRFPIKLTVILLFGLCVSASHGWSYSKNNRLAQPLLIALIGLWGLTTTSGLALSFLPDSLYAQLLTSLRIIAAGPVPSDLATLRHLEGALIEAGLWGFVTIIWLTNQASRAKVPVADWLMLSAIASMLFLNARAQLTPTVSNDFFDRRSELSQWLRKHSRQQLNEFRVLSLLSDPLLAPPAVTGHDTGQMDRRFMEYARAMLKPNTNIDSGVYLTNGESVIPSWLGYFSSTGVLARSALSTQTTLPLVKSDVPLFKWCQSTSTRYLLSPIYGIGQDGDSVIPVRLLNSSLFKVVREDQELNLRVYEISPTRPRFSIMSSWQIADSRYAALKIINRSDSLKYDPIHSVIVTRAVDSCPLSPESQQQFPDKGNVKLISQDNLSLKFLAEVSHPAFLVVTDSMYPGWHAEDNRMPTPIYLADGLSRAIFLSPGRHLITMSYSPISLFWGFIIWKLTFCVICALFVLEPRAGQG